MSANTQTIASIFSDLAIGATLNAMFLELAMDPNDFENSSLFFKSVDSVVSSATGTKRIPLLGLGRTPYAAIADGVPGTYTAVEREYVDVTVGRFNLNYQGTGFSQMIDPNGMLSLPMLALALRNARRLTITDALTGLFAGFNAGSTVGTTTVDFSITTLQTAKTTQELTNRVPSTLIVHSKMAGDLQSSLMSATGGAIQWLPATADMIQRKGNGYKGNILGIDVFASTRCPTASAGADYLGCLFAENAVAIAHGSPVINLPAQQMLLGTDSLLEMERIGNADLTNFPSNLFFGVAETGDDRGVPVIGSAS